MYTPKKVLALKSLYDYKQSWLYRLRSQLLHNNSNNNNSLVVVVEVSTTIQVGTEVEVEGEET